MRMTLILMLCLLAACGRPLTEGETAFADALAGPAVDTASVRFHNGHFAGSFTYTRPVRPRLTCQERIFPPSDGETVTVSPGAMVLLNTVLFRRDLYRDDLMPGFPGLIDLADAMLVAHELAHVWQWQNRAETGYHPLKAAREHRDSPDPYLFEPDTEGDFLTYGYEQQGAIVEEYVCCRLLDPQAPRTARLRDMISRHMPVDRLEQALDRPLVRLPWSGAEPRGICR
ncbi:hypothetical protein [Aestuariicoccus sp. MJ-SS9]|uniref:hypothetical protein n=1 Tax=Aestuariicoccus sp. MJ-SS9 TaxID=3079855 RepID=UPI00290D42B3|nr:hypothetical protein [Aestuariicoccus sp. MJ-SS9]MDU8912424.1 hypothetical protein [Aestuariicoccus sp. MJ-SS9]